MSEPEVSVNGFSPTVLLLRIETFDGFAASFGPEKRPSSSRGVAGFYWFAAEKIAVTLVVVVFARLKGVEFLGKSFAQEGPEVLLCAPLGKAQRLVFGDIGVENAHGVERGLGRIAVLLVRAGPRDMVQTLCNTRFCPRWSLSERATSEN